MLDEHWNAAEADCQRFYGFHLGEAVYGPHPMTARRLWALVSELPHDSAVARAMTGEAFGWRTEHELLAALIEVLDAGMRNLFVATLAPYSKGTPDVWDAVQVPRPGVQLEPATRAPLTIAEIQARLMEAGDADG